MILMQITMVLIVLMAMDGFNGDIDDYKDDNEENVCDDIRSEYVGGEDYFDGNIVDDKKH